MWSNLTKTFLSPEDNGEVIKVDPTWGFSEFPQPGDTKKHTLPLLIDHDALDAARGAVEANTRKEKAVETQQKEFWMPDKFCKVCYGCEESFTMYRRRHHCRMCGQIFCNNCSSFYIDGMLFNTPGLVRACRLCYDQLFERSENENKIARRKLEGKAEEPNPTDMQSLRVVKAGLAQTLAVQSAINKANELNGDLKKSINANLQSRAAAHFDAIIERLVSGSTIPRPNRDQWKETISSLVKEVVLSVDPDVRGGDGMDIRQYVKIKIIPGGSMEESIFVDGVVFRKNVSHKKMARNSGAKTNPRILLLAGGIEFQRTDTKLSSMDTLIEQEDKYMELLVDKIMSLRPDIILVGRAVARRAQELLCEHKVVVMQNVKSQLLERIGRMTGAMLLPSTDHMIQQFGEECMGTCGQFWLRVVHDDPEKSESSAPANRILRTRISRGSTYAYMTGCPSERGCTIVLRGDNRAALSEVKRIVEFGMVVAYHLRLEVMYYLDRGADLPSGMLTREQWVDVYGDGSDEDDQHRDEGGSEEGKNTPSGPRSRYGDIRVREERYYLSTSLDVDISLPYSRELVGTQLFLHQNKPNSVRLSSAELHQTLLVTSLLMGEGTTAVPVQKASAEVKGIKYYTKQDIALGQFIIDNCFQLGRFANRGESRMLDQTLSFIHRPGRIDITVHRLTESAASAYGGGGTEESAQRDPLRLPIFLSSYCKECRKTVTPLTMMSDETWKMSFGKFLEMFFYNRTARCKVGGCTHHIRDNHTLSFQCEGYVATFDFIPLHAYALHVREGMRFPTDFHNKHTASLLRTLPQKHAMLMEDFRMAVVVLERESTEILAHRPDDLALAMSDIVDMGAEIAAFTATFSEELLRTYLLLPKKYQDAEMEAMLRAQVAATSERAKASSVHGVQRFTGAHVPALTHVVAEVSTENPVHAEAETVISTSEPLSADVTCAVDTVDGLGDEDRWSSLTALGRPATARLQQPVGSMSMPTATVQSQPPQLYAPTALQTKPMGAPGDEYDEAVALSFPMFHWRQTYVRASSWNTRIDAIYRFLDSVRHLLVQQQQMHSVSQNPAMAADLLQQCEDDYHEARRPLLELQARHLQQAFQLPEPARLSSLLHETNPSVSGKESLMMMPPGSFSEPLPPVVPGTLMQTVTDFSVVAAKNSLLSLENTKKVGAEKPADKMSRVAKVITRFVMGGKDTTSADEHGKFVVPLGEFGEGRYGLKPGRRGEVIPVHEDEFASIIAYSLASKEYHDNLLESLREGDRAFTDEDDGDANFYNDSAMDTGGIHSTSKTLNDKGAGLPSHKDSGMAAPVGESGKSQANSQHPDEDEDADFHDLAMKGGDGENRTDGAAVARAFASAVKDSEMLMSASSGRSLFSGTGSAGSAMFNRGHNEGQDNDDASVIADSNADSSPKGARDATDVSVALPPESEDDDADQSRSPRAQSGRFPSPSTPPPPAGKSANEKQMISQDKSYIRHRFTDGDEYGNVTCKFQCQIYWAKQFEAVRSCYFTTVAAQAAEGESTEDSSEQFIRSLSMSSRWATQGGKSGAAFSKSMDDRLVVKVISRVELQMFLEFAPAYFEYMAKAYYHGLPTVLCKILGVYTVRYHNKESGKKVVENVVVMENIFYQRKITRTFDLKGSSRARYVDLGQKGDDFDEALLKRRRARRNKTGEGVPPAQAVSQVLLDDNLMELTRGRPFPLKHRAKLFFHKAVLNDTLFLSIVNVVDYSILVGFDENSHEIVVGIIDYMRQYDIIKKMERMGKSVGMLTGQAEPTIIQPSQYRKRFTIAMERYFMTIPDKWVSHDS